MTVMLLTNRQDFTADFVVMELQKRGADYIRLNTEDTPTNVDILWSLTDQANGLIATKKRAYHLRDITCIWYRRPVPPVPAEEIQGNDSRTFTIREAHSAYSGILRSLNCVWVSDPDNLHAASFKVTQLQKAVELGFRVPETIVTNIPERARDFSANLKSDIIYKPLAMQKLEGQNGKERLIFTNRVGPDQMKNLDQVKYTPCLFQQLIPKAADIRVTVIGSNLFAVAIQSQSFPDSRIDWRRGDSINLPHTKIDLPLDVEERCFKLVAELGLKFGAIDMVLDPEGEFWFLEINGNGQWAWIEQLTGLCLTAKLVDLLMANEH